MNKGITELLCPVSYVMNKLGGYWKPIILFQLMDGSKRYSEIKKAIPGITEKMLIQHLKQLQADDLIIRTAEAVVPPVVHYKLSRPGEELTPILDAMAAWAFKTTGTTPRKKEDEFIGTPAKA